MDCGLNFNTHYTKKQISKANRTMGMIRRSFKCLDEPTISQLYTSLVLPHLEYGHSARSPIYKKDYVLLKTGQDN